MKSFMKSRTVWVGALVTVMSVATIAVEAWALLGRQELLVLDDLFGPRTTAVLGVMMILLRVITTSPIIHRHTTTTSVTTEDTSGDEHL